MVQKRLEDEEGRLSVEYPGTVDQYSVNSLLQWENSHDQEEMKSRYEIFHMLSDKHRRRRKRHLQCFHQHLQPEEWKLTPTPYKTPTST